MREELLDKNVAKLVRSAGRPEDAATAADVGGDPSPSSAPTREDRLHALYVVLALLGLRRSEVLGLRWEDVDLEAGTLAVRRGSTGSRASSR